jgi:hypothetical protein
VWSFTCTWGDGHIEVQAITVDAVTTEIIWSRKATLIGRLAMAGRPRDRSAVPALQKLRTAREAR